MSNKEKYKELWELLPSDIKANLAFAHLVASGEPVNTQYFFGDYSLPILKWVIITLYTPKNTDIREVLYQFSGDYYDFVSSPVDENNKPQWYQLTSYRGDNGLKLKTWLQSHGYQYFSKKKIKTDKQSNSESELIEFVDYEALLGVEDGSDECSDKDLVYRKRLQRAWNELSERDKNILHILVVEKLHWKDAYDELNAYMKPREGRAVMEQWSDKRKQDALSLMKGRAIKHLIKRFNEQKRLTDEVR